MWVGGWVGGLALPQYDSHERERDLIYVFGERARARERTSERGERERVEERERAGHLFVAALSIVLRECKRERGCAHGSETHMHMHMHMQAHIHTRTRTHTHKHTHTHTHTHTHVKCVVIHTHTVLQNFTGSTCMATLTNN